MSALRVFNHPEFGTVRIVAANDEPWFIGRDVAQALGYHNPADALTRHVDGEDKDTIVCHDANVTVINESGLYSLVVFSKHRDAKKFHKWIMDDVLPSIYGDMNELDGMTGEELLAKALLIAHKKLKEQEAHIAALTIQNEMMAPKAKYFDDLAERNMHTTFGETAQKLGMTKKDFIQLLLDESYIYRDEKGQLQPNAAMNDGLFRRFSDHAKNGSTQTLITPKGRETFRLLSTVWHKST